MNKHIVTWLIQILISIILSQLTIILIKKNKETIFLQTLTYNRHCNIRNIEEIIRNNPEAKLIYKTNLFNDDYFYKHIINLEVKSKRVFYILNINNKKREQVMFMYKNYNDINENNNNKNINFLININKKCMPNKKNLKEISNIVIGKIDTIKIVNVHFYYFFIFYLLLIRFLKNLKLK
jgi:hypothetical protein